MAVEEIEGGVGGPGNLSCLVGHAARGRGWRGILPRATYIFYLRVYTGIQGDSENSCLVHEGVKGKGRGRMCRVVIT